MVTGPAPPDLIGASGVREWRRIVPILLAVRVLTEAEVTGDYEANTGAVIIERFRELTQAHVPAVLAANHGPFAWGASAREAVHNALAHSGGTAVDVGLALQAGAIRAPSISFGLDDANTFAVIAANGELRDAGQPADRREGVINGVRAGDCPPGLRKTSIG
jgi:phage tail protein X